MFVGEKGSIETGWNMRSGVKIRRGVIIKIWDDIESNINVNNSKSLPEKIKSILKRKTNKKKSRYVLYRYKDENSLEAALF
ncbi:MAG: hypothetical protein LBS34_03550 [Rickettsiales bacterium]|nr:hypothetical protein [Rickettsiales bacterium]